MNGDHYETHFIKDTLLSNQVAETVGSNAGNLTAYQKKSKYPYAVKYGNTTVRYFPDGTVDMWGFVNIETAYDSTATLILPIAVVAGNHNVKLTHIDNAAGSVGSGDFSYGMSTSSSFQIRSRGGKIFGVSDNTAGLIITLAWRLKGGILA